MSEFESTGEFPDPKFIMQWSLDSKHGKCCGIFGCPNKILVECEICGGGYCSDHKDMHFHASGHIGIIEK
jgi:hypothetical protein